MRPLSLGLGLLLALAVGAAAQSDLAAQYNLTEPGLYAVFETSMGAFVARLFEDQAPQTVENFVGLATGTKPWRAVDKQVLSEQGLQELGLAQRQFTSQEEVQAARAELENHIAQRVQELPEHRNEPFYEGVKFHRVAPGFVIQAGSPPGVANPGAGGPGFSIPDELTPALQYDQPGRLAMANSGPNTGGSQFFVTVRPTPELDFTAPQNRARHAGWAIFGQVVRGMDVVQAINQVPVNGETPRQDVTIEHVRIVRVGEGPQPPSPTTAAQASPASPE
jgi:peptidyl-prolyl cis-trans isomerase A (cyclophilin A)